MTPKTHGSTEKVLDLVQLLACNELSGGTGIAGAATVVHGEDVYYVRTLGKSVLLGNVQKGLTHKVLEFLNGRIAALADLVWIRPLNRRLQRLFGWGDVNIPDMKEEVDRCAKEGEFCRVRTLVPQFSLYTDAQMDECRNILSCITTAMFKPLSAIQDCEHNWIAHIGPCLTEQCPSKCVKTWSTCTGCSMIRCGFCVSKIKSDNSLDEDIKEHVEALKSAVKCEFRLHPDHGRPFSVVDSTKMPESDKLEWLRAEFEPEGTAVTLEDLPSFVKMCQVFFHAKTEKSQKSTIYPLFEKFAGIPIGKEASLPPALREKLSKLWGEAKKYCRECGGCIDRGEFCNDLCEIHFRMERFRCPKCDNVQPPRPTESWGLPVGDGRWMMQEVYKCKKCGHHADNGVTFNTTFGTKKRLAGPIEEVERDDHAWKSRRKA